MNISALNHKSPPAYKKKAPSAPAKSAGQTSSDAFVKSDKGSISLGAGVLAAVSLFGMASCTPPPTQEHPPEVVAEKAPQTQTESNLAKEDDEKPMTELEIRQRELELREREVAVKERELEVLSKREKGESRLRKLQEQREAREKAERIGKGIEDTISILDALGGALKEGVDDVLK